MKKNKEILQDNIKKISQKELITEINRESYKEKYIKILKSTIYSLIIILAISILAATLIMPVLEISGSSMSPILNEGEIVISIKNKKLNTGDIIAFYHGNKILTKRVIAKPGNWVNIDKDGLVYIDGSLLKEDYIKEKTLGSSNIEYPYQVPAEHWFVLGDDRHETIDSRNSDIGSISKENIIGKIVFRIWPLKKFGFIS